MLAKQMQNHQMVEMVCTDTLVPEDHLLRQIGRAVDFRKTHRYVEGLYSAHKGLLGVDPLVLFRMALIRQLYGIRRFARW